MPCRYSFRLDPRETGSFALQSDIDNCLCYHSDSQTLLGHVAACQTLGHKKFPMLRSSDLLSKEFFTKKIITFVCAY